MILLVVRHGEPGWQRPGGRFDRDPALTALGRRQAAALADRLAGMGITDLYSSPALRCLETAQPIAAAAGLRGKAVPWLAEWGCVWEYRGPAAVDMERRLPALDPAAPPDEAGWGWARLESKEDPVGRSAQRQRAAAVRDLLLQAHPRTEADRVCLCTHFGFGGCRLLPALLESAEPAPGIRAGMDLDHAALTVVECDAEWNWVVRSNCTQHLAGLMLARCADPHCGWATDGHWGDAACRRCGGRLLRRCPACRSAIPAPAADRCPECGTPYGPA